MGYMLETSRINKINSLYLNTEIELLDQIIQKEASGVLSPSCKILIEENIKFGDSIYAEAQIIEEYENANQMSAEIEFQHKRFDLLRTLFLTNSIKIKQGCNSSYHNIVYLYQYNDPDTAQSSKQRFFSNALRELKEKYGSEIMLIPIAGDNDIPSVNLLRDNYNITQLPSVLIDEKVVLTEIGSLEELENYLN